MTSILLGQSYYLRFDPKLYAAMQPYPPLGTLYAASCLRQRGYAVRLFDAMLAASDREWCRALDLHRPRYAILYEDNFNYLSKMCLLKMRGAAFRMTDAAKEMGCTVIACGADVTDRAELYLQRGVDFVIRGEGEKTLVQLLDALEGRERIPLPAIAGISWIGSGGAVKHNNPRPPSVQLDALPFPAWDLIDIERYRRLWKSRHGRFSVNMVTTRGCPYHCNWCAKPIWGQRYNSRSPENVAAELKLLRQEYRPDHIWFADDIFGLKPGWVERFGRLVAEERIALPFKCQMRADLINRSVVEGLEKAGCDTVWIGAESGSQKILDAMEKGITLEQIGRARSLLAASGIRTAFFIQFGYPGETREDVELTLQMIRELSPDEIGISVSYPLPGTPFHGLVRTQLGEKQNWDDSDDLAMLYHGPFPASFYRMLYRAVHAEFRLRKAVSLIRPGRLRPARARSFRTLASIPKHWLAWRLQQYRMHRFRDDDGGTLHGMESG